MVDSKNIEEIKEHNEKINKERRKNWKTFSIESSKWERKEEELISKLKSIPKTEEQLKKERQKKQLQKALMKKYEIEERQKEIRKKQFIEQEFIAMNDRITLIENLLEDLIKKVEELESKEK